MGCGESGAPDFTGAAPGWTGSEHRRHPPRVALAVRPWATNVHLRDLDRTATGDHGETLAAAVGRYVALQRFWQDIGAYPNPVRERLSPLDPASESQFATIEMAAATPGLTAVALLDAYPTGYAKGHTNLMGSYYYSTAVDGFLSYGYSDRQRRAFLESEHVDPLDLENRLTRTNVSVSEVWVDTYMGTEAFDKWQVSRGKWVHDAMVKLVGRLTVHGVPVLVPPQQQNANIHPYRMTYLQLAKPGADLPSIAPDFMGEDAAKTSDSAVAEIVDDDDLGQRARVATTIKAAIDNYQKPLILDFSDVPEDRLDAVLATWLAK